MKRVLLALLCIGMTGCAGCTRISPGYVGIKVTNLGAGKGVNDIPVLTGWQAYNMFTESIFDYPTFVQTYAWTQNTAEGKPFNEEITFTNKDSMRIAADVSVAYSLVPERVPHFYVKFRSDDLSSFTYGFLRNLARDVFNDVAGRYTIDQIMGDNGPLLKEVRAELQKQLDPIGVKLEQFGFIGAPRPPDAVITAINMKVQAMQLALQKQNEIIQAEADAKKTVARAEGTARATLVEAEAQAQANRKLAESITANLVEYQKIQKWDGHLPTVSGSSGILMSMPGR